MTLPNIQHKTTSGGWHPGRLRYCGLCTPPPHPTLIPVVPASRRGDYQPPQITTTLIDRHALIELCDSYSRRDRRGALTERLEEPSIGTRVLFSLSARIMAAGVIETTGYAGTRVAYIHPADLVRARREGHAVDVRRARPSAFFALPEEGSDADR